MDAQSDRTVADLIHELSEALTASSNYLYGIKLLANSPAMQEATVKAIEQTQRACAITPRLRSIIT